MSFYYRFSDSARANMYVNNVVWGKYHLELNLPHYVGCGDESFTLTIQIFNNISNSRLHRKSFIINQGSSTLLSETVFVKVVNCAAGVGCRNVQ